MKKVDIQKLIDIPYATDTRVARRKGAGSTQEFFTPYSIVKRMADKISKTDWMNPEKLFLEPCFGSGNFCLYIIYNRLLHKIDWEIALRTLYGVELMEDNVQECKERILNLLDLTGIKYDRDLAIQIMEHNLVCSDFFKWDFEHWKPIITESEMLF